MSFIASIYRGAVAPYQHGDHTRQSWRTSLLKSHPRLLYKLSELDDGEARITAQWILSSGQKVSGPSQQALDDFLCRTRSIDSLAQEVRALLLEFYNAAR